MNGCGFRLMAVNSWKLPDDCFFFREAVLAVTSGRFPDGYSSVLKALGGALLVPQGSWLSAANSWQLLEGFISVEKDAKDLRC